MDKNEIFGIILTVKWPYQEPEIVFYYPPNSFTILTEEDATIPIKECFGLECSKLAPLILPSDSILCNKISDLVIETKNCQNRFLFCPCFISNDISLITQNKSYEKEKMNIFQIEEKVNLKKQIESFSITLVLNASIDLNYEFITENLDKFAKVLLKCESTIGLISKETIKTNDITFEYLKSGHNLVSKLKNNVYVENYNSEMKEKKSNSEENLIKIIEEKSPLAQKLVKFLTNFTKDYNNITLNLKCSNICNNFDFEKKTLKYLDENYDKYTIIIDNQKLSNLCNKNELINQLIKTVDPHLSIKEISRNLLESPTNILNVCHHLLSQGAATIIDVINYKKIYIIVPDKIRYKMSLFNREFNDIIDWKNCNPLITISSFFCKGNVLSKVRDELIEFFQKSSIKKKKSEIIIYTPYNSFNNVFNSTIDEARKTTKSIISWLAINNCIVISTYVRAPNDFNEIEERN